jgi:U3 small nucleolar RNA-associated protein 20
MKDGLMFLLQMVLQVNIDVYQRRGPIRSEPLAGASTFFQEELKKQRELHTAGDFLQAAAAINPLVQTLPQLIHHKVIH